MNFSSNGRKVEEPPQIIKANIYDNPQFALDLVAHICTEKEDIEIDSFFDVYKQKRENLINEVSDLDDVACGDVRFGDVVDGIPALNITCLHFDEPFCVSVGLKRWRAGGEGKTSKKKGDHYGI